MGYLCTFPQRTVHTYGRVHVQFVRCLYSFLIACICYVYCIYSFYEMNDREEMTVKMTWHLLYAFINTVIALLCSSELGIQQVLQHSVRFEWRFTQRTATIHVQQFVDTGSSSISSKIHVINRELEHSLLQWKIAGKLLVHSVTKNNPAHSIGSSILDRSRWVRWARLQCSIAEFWGTLYLPWWCLAKGALWSR